MDKETIAISMAEQQLSGFFHAKNGQGITSLVQSMALKKEEWEKMKADWDLAYLKQDDIEAIDEIVESN